MKSNNDDPFAKSGKDNQQFDTGVEMQPEPVLVKNRFSELLKSNKWK